MGENNLSVGSKALIVYFTRTGNTREIANHIHKMVGGDIVEIQTVEPYPADYNAVVNKAKQELSSSFKPAIKTKVDNIAAYDVVFVGSPNWWSTIAPPVITFLSENDLSGKTVAPFVTHGGGGMAQCVVDIRKLCKNAIVTDGISVSGDSAKTAQREVAEWLREIGLAK